MTRLDEAGLAHLAAACAAAEVVARWRAKIVTVEGSDCQWWTGAVSGAVMAASGWGPPGSCSRTG